jgi:hypothetical protein
VEQGARRITSENGVLFQMIQLGALQDPLFRVYGPPMTFIEIGEDLASRRLQTTAYQFPRPIPSSTRAGKGPRALFGL